MNIYDALHNLTSAIKNSQEFQKYQNAAKVIDENPEYSAMMGDFMRMQLDFSTMKLFGTEPNEEQIQKFNEMYNSLCQITAATEFINSQMYFSKILEDITKEISEAVKIDASFMDIAPSFDEE